MAIRAGERQALGVCRVLDHRMRDQQVVAGALCSRGCDVGFPDTWRASHEHGQVCRNVGSQQGLQLRRGNLIGEGRNLIGKGIVHGVSLDENPRNPRPQGVDPCGMVEETADAAGVGSMRRRREEKQCLGWLRPVRTALFSKERLAGCAARRHTRKGVETAALPP